MTRLWLWSRERLEDPWAPRIAVGLGVVLTMGSFGNGIVLEVLVDGVGYLGELGGRRIRALHRPRTW
ncbi:MAG TPA: hypothetical protein ENK57_14925 [Polyangiaceae bacterium]|nr:hypothetical protein [Polyangiaceae bacterium]